jgi:hypothetical protein
MGYMQEDIDYHEHGTNIPTAYREDSDEEEFSEAESNLSSDTLISANAPDLERSDNSFQHSAVNESAAARPLAGPSYNFLLLRELPFFFDDGDDEEENEMRVQHDIDRLDRISSLLTPVLKPEDPICSICHDPYHIGHEPCKLPCGHVYGEECIFRWLIGHERTTCPLCRWDYS